MLNKGKCSNVRPAITEKICEEMRDRKALVCRECPGPAGKAVEVAADPAQQAPDVKVLISGRPGFFVDFTGHEDLLEKFKDAATERGMKPGESALDLIYLFAEGLLCLIEEIDDEEDGHE
jgi:hypothetical protein